MRNLSIRTRWYKSKHYNCDGLCWVLTQLHHTRPWVHKKLMKNMVSFKMRLFFIGCREDKMTWATPVEQFNIGDKTKSVCLCLVFMTTSLPYHSPNPCSNAFSIWGCPLSKYGQKSRKVNHKCLKIVANVLPPHQQIIANTLATKIADLGHADLDSYLKFSLSNVQQCQYWYEFL